MMKTPEGGAHGEAVAGPESPLSPPLSPASAAAAALLNGRWNPTKEQVAVLEELYEHGLRTPSAEQIQNITGRLREHGPVEAKNVFYWFQNHKARHRQKQKQDSFAYFTRLLRRPPPLPVIARPPGYPLGRLPVSSPPVMMSMALPPRAPCNNGGGGTTVMYRAPYYMPAPQTSSAANAAGYYNLQQAAHHMAAMYPRMESAAQDNRQMNLASSMYEAAPYGMSNPPRVVPPANGGEALADHPGRISRQTLELFPLRPTFMLPGSALVTSPAPSASAPFSGESESLVGSPNSNVEALPFYDFLGLQSAGR